MGGIKGSRTRTEAHLFGHCSKLHERQAGAKTVTEKPWNHPCFPSDTGERGGQWRPMVTEQVMVTATPGTTDLPEEASLRLFLKSGSWKTETLPQGYKYPVNSRTRLEPAQGLPLWRGCGDQLLPWIVRCPWGCLSLSLSLSCSHRSQTESGIYKRTELLAWQKLWQRYSQLESINKYIRNFCLKTHLHKEDWS